jgi:hypothetical protein
VCVSHRVYDELGKLIVLDLKLPEVNLVRARQSGFTATVITPELLKWFFLRKNHANVLHSCKDLR